MTQLIKELLTQLKENRHKQYRSEQIEKPIAYPLDLFGFNFGTPFKAHWSVGNVTVSFPAALAKGFLAIR